MLGIELTEKEKKIWGELGDTLAATVEIRSLALQYYLEYREHLNKNKLNSEEIDKITNLLQISYFVSEKSQIMFNMRGERVSAVALSINEIMKRNTNFEDFIFHMKEMLKVITIENTQALQEIENCLKKFKFTMTFHHKFVSTFKKLKPVSIQHEFSQSLLWLIFIFIKQNTSHQTQNDIIEMTCLIASAFIFYSEECMKFSNTDLELDDSNYGGVLRKESVVHVFLEYFRLKDINKFQEVSIFFKDEIEKLKDKIGFETFFCESNVEQTYKKIDCFYMKKLNDSSIDERHFLKERINTVMNANRFTPFGGRRYATKTKSSQIPSQILSHRVLNYDKEQEEKGKLFDIENEERNESVKVEKSGSILIKKLALNKTPAQRTPLIKATPMTNAMEMYNWVLEKSNYHKLDLSEISKYINVDEKTAKLINGLWKDVCLNEEDKGLVLNEKDKLAILILATEICCFVTNSIDNSIEKMATEMGVSWFGVWAKIDNFLTYDSRMPTSIKLHLLSLDTSLISKQLWRKSEAYCQIFKDAKIRSEKVDYERLYRRVIHEMVYQIFFLSKSLEIPEESMNSIFLLCQFALFEFTNLIVGRSLYHLILCSTFAVSRAQNLEKSFFNILSAFQYTNSMDKSDYLELTEQIYKENSEDVDIIIFYNEYFVVKTKPLLLQIKYQSNTVMENLQIFSSSNRKNLISSPVKDLLPRNVIALGDRTNKSPLQTPMTLALQAYHESPLLKERKIKNLANCIDGKRIMEKKGEYSKEESLKQASSLISQKWSKAKSPEHKLMGTIKKGNENI